MTTPDDSSDLKAAWGDLAENARAFDDCPAADRIWDAAHGELGPETTRELVEHVATCPACAEAWRLARAIEPPQAGTAHSPAPGSPRRWIALAAMVVLAVVLGWRVLEGPADEDIERGAPPLIEALVPDGGTLPRGAFELAWTPGPEGSRYDLLVTTADLEVVARGTRLDAPRYVIPARDLATVDDGTELLWRVETALPDGRHIASPAFRVFVK